MHRYVCSHLNLHKNIRIYVYISCDVNHLLHRSNFHNWNKGRNRGGKSQTIQLPYASQCPCLEREKSIQSV